MTSFALGALAHLLQQPLPLGLLVHPPITSPEIKHLAAKMLGDPTTSQDARRLAGSVMAHIERQEARTKNGVLAALLNDYGQSK